MLRVYDKNDKTPTAIDRLLGNPALIAAAAGGLAVGPVLLIGGLYWLWPKQLQEFLSSQFCISMVVLALSLFIIIHLCAGLILAERKISAFIQDRKGPNRVGLWGIAQPIADGIKFILKEDITPKGVDKPIFILAPCIAFVLALIGFAVIPWAGRIHWPWMPEGQTVITQAADLDIGLLYILAVGSLAVYGVVLAGWASNNKYAHFGGMRATAQMLSYEVPLGLGLLVLVLHAGDLRLQNVIDQQAQTGLWNVFVHPVAFLLVLTAAFAETNRAPFDLAECEHELVAGFHTEYSSMKFALFFLAEYSHMVTACAVLACLFLGGSDPLPFVGWLAHDTSPLGALVKFGVIWGKIVTLVIFFMVIRWTVPRFRFDQLMRLAWKAMVPLGMAAVVVVALAVALGWRIAPDQPAAKNWLCAGVMLALNVAMLAVAMWISGRSKTPVTGRQENLPSVEAMT